MHTKFAFSSRKNSVKVAEHILGYQTALRELMGPELGNGPRGITQCESDLSALCGVEENVITAATRQID